MLSFLLRRVSTVLSMLLIMIGVIGCSTNKTDSPSVSIEGNHQSNIYSLEKKGDVKRIQFSGDSKYLVVAFGSTNDDNIIIWDLTNKSVYRSFATPGPYGNVSVWDMELSPDGNFIAVTDVGHHLNIWHVLENRLITRQKLSWSSRSLDFDPTGQIIATVAEDRDVQVWDAETGQELLKMQHLGSPSYIDFKPFGEQFITASGDGIARIWNSITGEEITQIPMANYEGYAISGFTYADYSKTGKYLVTIDAYYNVVTIGEYHNVVLRDGSTNEPIYSFQSASSSLKTSITDNEDFLAIADGNMVSIIRLLDNEIVARLQHDSEIRSLAFSPDGSLLATGSGVDDYIKKDTNARVWDWKQNESTPIIIIPFDSVVGNVAFSPDGKIMAAGSWNLNGELKLWMVK